MAAEQRDLEDALLVGMAASRKQLPHDKRVCIFAAANLAKSRNGGSLVVDSFPDEDERNRPAVDLVAHDDFGPIVGEHTVAEAYEEQVHDNKRAREVFAGFDDRFDHELDTPGRYTLIIDTTGKRQLPRKDAERPLVESLDAWVRSQQIPVPDLAANYVEAGPPEVPFPVTLYRARCMPEDNGSLHLAFGRSKDVEASRVDTITRAFVNKCPKLEAARLSGCVTLLVLESRDYMMSDPWQLMRATFTAAHGREDIPDAIVWVDTAAGLDEDHWMVYTAKNDPWSNAALGASRSERPIQPAVVASLRRSLRLP